MDGLRPAPLSSVVLVVVVVAADGWWEEEGAGGGAMGWESSSTGGCWGCVVGVEVGGGGGAAMVIRWCVGRGFLLFWLRRWREGESGWAAGWVGGVSGEGKCVGNGARKGRGVGVFDGAGRLQLVSGR